MSIKKMAGFVLASVLAFSCSSMDTGLPLSVAGRTFIGKPFTAESADNPGTYIRFFEDGTGEVLYGGLMVEITWVQDGLIISYLLKGTGPAEKPTVLMLDKSHANLLENGIMLFRDAESPLSNN